MIPKNSVALKFATRRTRYASGSRRATRNERSVSTASCFPKLVSLCVSTSESRLPSTSSRSHPNALPSVAAQASSTLRTPASGVKSLLTKSRMNSAGLVSTGGGNPTFARYAPIFLALPKYATRPMLSTMVLSKPANTLAGGWWIVHTTATFCVAATVCKKLIMRTALAESTPEVGSSRNKMFGCLTSASATDRRRLLPLDRPLVISLPARVSMKSSSPTARAMSSTAAR
mmetsp:Transcript_5863/g.24862  ORF Transcript_5863/g.24862 Transcript_5863/m.24862 type:complete len:230 (+) Transcript_5863:4245-4934(+)